MNYILKQSLKMHFAWQSFRYVTHWAVHLVLRSHWGPQRTSDEVVGMHWTLVFIE